MPKEIFTQAGGLAGRLWAVGEMPPMHEDAASWPAVWYAWQRKLHLRPPFAAPLLYLAGPVHSGRHRLARALLQAALHAGQRCVWLGVEAPWGLPEASPPGELWYGRTADSGVAAAMLETLMAHRAAQTVVWVLAPATCPSWLQARWSLWGAQARAQGTCVLVVAPPVTLGPRPGGPAWQLSKCPSHLGLPNRLRQLIVRTPAKK